MPIIRQLGYQGNVEYGPANVFNRKKLLANFKYLVAH